MEGLKEGFVAVGRVSEIPKGEGRVRSLRGREIALFHLESGEIRAVENACPHRGGPLVHGILAGESVICPLHGWRIDLRDGRATEGEGCATVFPVRIDNGEVLILMV